MAKMNQFFYVDINNVYGYFYRVAPLINIRNNFVYHCNYSHYRADDGIILYDPVSKIKLN